MMRQVSATCLVIMLVVLGCGGNSKKGEASMEFQIELAKSEALIQESIPITFRLVNGPKAVAIPLDYATADVVTLMLLDAQGREIARADGYAKLQRQRPYVRRLPQDSLETDELGPEQTMQWEDDLLVYMDLLTPGDYFLKASFQFAPSHIASESGKIPFRIVENVCRGFDILRDQVSMEMVYLVQRPEPFGPPRALFQIANGSTPPLFRKGSTAEIATDQIPRISEADFVTQDTSDHDFFRWLAWIEQDTLFATSVEESHFFGKTYAHALGETQTELVGRPIQRSDRGVSFFTLQRTTNAAELVRLNFDRAFANGTRKVLTAFDLSPTPLSVSCDRLGEVFAVAARDGGLPVRLLQIRGDETPRQTDVLTAADFPELNAPNAGHRRLRILQVFPDVKVFSELVKAILVTALLEDERGQALKLVRIPLLPEGAAKAQILNVPLVGILRADKEQIISADMVQTPRAELHAILSTSLGNILYFGGGDSLQTAATIDPKKASLPRLVVSTPGDIYLFFPEDARGVGHRVVYRKVRR